MTARWRVTPALTRALLVAAAAAIAAVATGRPAGLVLAAPFAVAVVPALLRRPRSAPVLEAGLDHRTLTEGQGTTSRLTIDLGDDDSATGDIELVSRVTTRRPLVLLAPADGTAQAWYDGGDGPVVEIGPRRWGLHDVGEEQVALASPWAGYRWGPVTLPARRVRVLPAPSAYRSTSELPQPGGLVGAHRSAQAGTGTELAGIRPYRTGDRLRRINWPVSARTSELHVTTTRAERDSGLLLVLDVLAEHGLSGGVDGAASSLDLTVRAAAALAEHATARGDRVGMRPVGGRGRTVNAGSGRRHAQRILSALSELEPGATGDEVEDADGGARLRLPVPAGSTVVVLSPLLVDAVVVAAATLLRRGLPVVVVDTLPDGVAPAVPDGTERAVAELAWSMRLVERENVRRALTTQGCPVVVWRGPGTVDEVMLGLARRARQPRARAR